jgi:hypothetical protein
VARFEHYCLCINVVTHFTGQFTAMILTTRYWTFWTRVRKEFFAGFVIITAAVLYTYFKENNDFGVFGLMIFGFGVVYMIAALFKAKTFVNEVKFTEDKIIVTGHHFDSRWTRKIDIKTSDIKIKSEGLGRGNVEYYLRIISSDKTVDINRSFTWDYTSLLTIFHEFKRIKGEKIIFDEKCFLDIMEKKAKRIFNVGHSRGK